MHERPRRQLPAAGDDGTKPAPGHSSRLRGNRLCLTRTHCAGRNATSVRASLRPHRLENSSAKRFITSVRASTARDRPDRRSRSDFPRHDAQAWTCHRPRRARYPRRHARARSAPTNVGMVRRRVASRRPGGSAPPGAPSGASHTPRHLIAPSPGRRSLQPPDERGYSAQLRLGRRRVPRARRDDRPPPGRRRAHARTAPGPEHLHINRGGKGLSAERRRTLNEGTR